eukprot:3215560-Pleurochrysis_carterae.AAC.3
MRKQPRSVVPRCEHPTSTLIDPSRPQCPSAYPRLPQHIPMHPRCALAAGTRPTRPALPWCDGSQRSPGRRRARAATNLPALPTYPPTNLPTNLAADLLGPPPNPSCVFKVQEFAVRADSRCGSTIGPIIGRGPHARPLAQRACGGRGVGM